MKKWDSKKIAKNLKKLDAVASTTEVEDWKVSDLMRYAKLSYQRSLGYDKDTEREAFEACDNLWLLMEHAKAYRYGRFDY